MSCNTLYRSTEYIQELLIGNIGLRKANQDTKIEKNVGQNNEGEDLYFATTEKEMIINRIFGLKSREGQAHERQKNIGN